MKCWRCNEQIEMDFASCPNCNAELKSIDITKQWTKRTNFLTNFKYKHIFSFLFYPFGALILIDLITDFSLKLTDGYQWLRILFFALAIFCSANHSDYKGEHRTALFNLDKEQNPTAFNLTVDIVLLCSLLLFYFSISSYLKSN